MFDAFLPERTLVTFGSIAIHWYGVFAALAAVTAFVLGRFLAKRAGLSSNTFDDAFFLALVAGLVGARLWHVAGDIGFYLNHPGQIVAIWNGGLAFHGGLMFGALALFVFARRKSVSFWLLADLFAPLLAIAHAIGRWGNYFNQELFGRPTALPWGIPIAAENRPAAVAEASHFHPIFLYEFIGLLLIAGLLVFWFLKRTRLGRETHFFDYGMLFGTYLVLTGLLRFGIEALRVDPVLTLDGIRVPQLISLSLTLAGLAFFLTLLRRRTHSTTDDPTH